MPVSYLWHTAVTVAPRPVPFTDEQRETFKAEIIDWISDGRTLREYCRQEGYPAFQTVYLWLGEDAVFARRFARARLCGAEAIAADTLEIADDARNDWMERLDEEGRGVGWQINGEHVKRSALRIDTRLKLLSKWFPTQYGDRANTREPLRIELPPIKTAADLPAAFEAVELAMREGRISIAELEAVHKILAMRRAAFGEAEFARELAELRARVEGSGQQPPAASAG